MAGRSRLAFTGAPRGMGESLLRRRAWRRPDRARQLDSPGGPAEVKGPFGLDERGRSALENPDVIVGRLLAENRREQPGEAADLDFDDVVGRAPAQACGGKW